MLLTCASIKNNEKAANRTLSFQQTSIQTGAGRQPQVW